MSITFKSFLQLNESKDFDIAWSGKSEDGKKVSGSFKVSAVNQEDAEKAAKKKLSKDKETKSHTINKLAASKAEKKVEESVMDLTADNLHDFTDADSQTLEATKDWQMIKHADQHFANKLLVAWDGDARRYERDGHVDSMFLKMVDPKNIERLSKIKHNSAVERNLERCALLFKQVMPSKENDKYTTPDDVWKN